MARKQEIKIGVTKKRDLAKKYAASRNKKSGPYSYAKLRVKYGSGTASEIVGMGKEMLAKKRALHVFDKINPSLKKSKPKSAAKKTTAKWVYYYKGKKTTKAKYDEMKKLGRKSAKRKSAAKMALGAKRARAMATEAKAKYKRSPAKYKAECKKFFKTAKPKIATSKKTRKKYIASVWVQFTKKFGVPLAKILLKECKIKLKNYSSDHYTRKGATFTRKRK